MMKNIVLIVRFHFPKDAVTTSQISHKLDLEREQR